MCGSVAHLHSWAIDVALVSTACHSHICFSLSLSLSLSLDLYISLYLSLYICTLRYLHLFLSLSLSLSLSRFYLDCVISLSLSLSLPVSISLSSVGHEQMHWHTLTVLSLSYMVGETLLIEVWLAMINTFGLVAGIR